MIKRLLMMLILVALVLAGVFGFEAFRGKMISQMMAAGANPSQTVTTIIAKYEDWQPTQEAVGTLRAAKGVDISNEVAGTVEEIHFNSGEDIKAGTPLLSIHAEEDIARLHSLEAAANLARTTLTRDKAQFKVQAVSKATIDNDAANVKSTEAQVEEQKALVAKKFIRAPFSGHLGIRQVDPGQFMPSGTLIVTLQALDPMFMDFFLPQQTLADLRTGQAVVLHNDTYPDRSFTGKIIAINPKVDQATRNVQVRASFKNTDHSLLPGMYSTASIHISDPVKRLTIPQTAISYNPYGNTVFVVKENGKDDKGNSKLVAEQRFVILGKTRGDQVAIDKGIEENEQVVTSGQIKLRAGSTLIINNTIAPTNDAHPTPKDE